MLILLFVVGMLLYFNMTVGDVVAAWLQRREDRDELADAEARQARAPLADGADSRGTGRDRRQGRASWSASAPPSAAERRTTSRR